MQKGLNLINTNNTESPLTKSQNETSYQRIKNKELQRKINKDKGIYRENETLKRDIDVLNYLLGEALNDKTSKEDIHERWAKLYEDNKQVKEY